MADYRETVVKLRQEIQEAVALGTINTDLYAQQVMQLLNSCESVKQKAQSEIERLTGQIGECRGSIKAADTMAGLLVETVAAYNRQERKRLEEEKRVEAERLERAASAVVAPAESVEPSVPALDEEEEEEDKPKPDTKKRGRRG